jgi:hypoxanthine phosphoribosyltransferase
VSLHDDVEEILLDSETVANRVAELAAQLSADYAGRDPVLVSVLKGALVFLADLMRAMDLPSSIDLIIVEDIIDTGLTLNYLLRYLWERNPASIRICCLLDKPARRLAEIPIDYVGFTIPDRFVIGYGLDYNERYRNLPYIGVLKPSVYGGAPPEG